MFLEWPFLKVSTFRIYAQYPTPMMARLHVHWLLSDSRVVQDTVERYRLSKFMCLEQRMRRGEPSAPTG
jgi:hypothetical protein